MSEWSVRRINAALAANGGTRYLEVGVAEGQTFLAVQAAHKVAVDPFFAFDPPNQPGMEFHRIPSDLFFTSRSRGREFDVVFLDGLHEFEQTYRDFCNALERTLEHSVIIIDDVWPLDAIGAMRNLEDSLAARQQAGDPSRSYWGDVYKMIPAIHDFHPSLTYATTTDGGNGQLIVWRGDPEPRSPRYDSFAAIAGLTFDDFATFGPILRINEVDAIMRRIARDVRAAN